MSVEWHVPGYQQLPLSPNGLHDYPLNTQYRILVFRADTGAYANVYEGYSVNWAGRDTDIGFTASDTIDNLQPNTWYTFNMVCGSLRWPGPLLSLEPKLTLTRLCSASSQSCTNSDPDSPYVTGWNYNSWLTPDPVGLLWRTSPSAPATLSLTLAYVVVANSSLYFRMGDATSRPSPAAYGNPITHVNVQVQDLDASGGPTTIADVTGTTTLAALNAGDDHATSAALYIGEAPNPDMSSYDISAFDAAVVSPANDYRIRVETCNDEGCSAYSSWLQVHTVHRPEAMVGLNALSVSGRTIQIGWQAATISQLHCPSLSCLTGYNVEVTRGTSSPTLHFVAKSNYAPSYTTVPQLADYATTVYFRVCAVNNYGSGVYSDFFNVTSLAGPVSVGTITVGRRPTPQTALTYTWQAGAVDGNGGATDMFELYLCAGTSSAPTTSTGCTTLAASAIISCPAAGGCSAPAEWYDTNTNVFQPGYYYRLRVRANSTAFPDFADNPFTTTGQNRNYELPNAPTAASVKPDNGGVNNITNLWVEWNAGYSYPGVSTSNGYRIEWSVDNVTQNDVTPSADEWRFENLPARATVQLRIVQRNAIGWSQPGPYAGFETAAPRPPEAPEEPMRGTLFVSNDVTNVTAIAVKWNMPPSLAVSITAYWLEVQGGTEYPNATRVQTNGASLFAQVADLSNGTEYTFRVAAFNEAGWGPFSPPATLSTWPGQPPQAPQEPTLCNNGLYSSSYSVTTSVYVGFLPPYDFEQRITMYQIDWAPSTLSGRNSIQYAPYGTSSSRQCRVMPSNCALSQTRNSPYPCLTPNTTYTITVRARNAEGWGDASPPMQYETAPGTPPGQPVMLQPAELNPGSSNITNVAFRWSAPDSVWPITGYRVYQTVNNGVPQLIDTTSRFTTSRQYAMAPGSTFTFQVIAENAFGSSAMSPPASFSTAPSRAPETPQPYDSPTLPRNYYKTTAVLIDWSMPSTYDDIGAYVDRYEVEYCGPLPSGSCTITSQGNSTTTSFLHRYNSAPPVPQPSNNYSYSVRARSSYNGDVVGWSEWSAPVVVETDAARAPGTPRPRVQNTAGWNNATSIRVAWSAPTSYGLSITNYWLVIGTSNPINLNAAQSYIHRPLNPSTEYYYKVKACSRILGLPLCSGYSAWLNATTAPAAQPSQPHSLTSSGMSLCCGLRNITAVGLDWAAPQADLGISYYFIYINGTQADPTSAFNAGCNGCRIMSPGSNSYYTYTGLPPGSNATWAVAAVDSDGQMSPISDLASFTLAPPVRPLRPARPYAGGTIGGLSRSTYISIAWFLPESIGLSVTDYRVRINAGLGDEIEIQTYSALRQFVRQPLPPNTTYTFEVQAYNDAGWSLYSPPYITSTLAAAAPNAPYNVRFGDLCCGFSNVTALGIRWNVGGNDLGISYFLVTFNDTRTERSGSASYTLTQQYPGSTTLISIVAVGVDGQESPPSTPLNFTLEDPLPPRIPVNLRQIPPVSGLSPAITTVAAWTPPRSYGLGIESYTAVVTELDATGAPVSTQNISVAGWRSSYAILGRRPATNYTFTLQAESSAGVGSASQPVLLSTAEGTRPPAPEAPRRGTALAGVSDVSTFFITWRPPFSPAYSVTNFKIEVYEVLDPASGSMASTPTFTSEVGFKTTYLYRCGTDFDSRCQPQSTYAFRVAAENAIDWSDFSPFLQLTSAPARPPYQPAPVRGTVSTNYWLSRGYILAFWRAPYDDGLPITVYELKVTNYMTNNQPAWSQTSASNHPCSSTECTTQIDAMTFNTPVYEPLANRTFSVRAYNGNWSQWSSPTALVAAGPLAPLQMRPVRNSYELRPYGYNNCSSITVSWTEASSASQSINRYETRMDDDDTTIREYQPWKRVGAYNVGAGTSHCFQVRAWNTFRGQIYNASEWSAPACFSSSSLTLPNKPEPVEREIVPGLSNTTSIAVGWRVADNCGGTYRAWLLIDNHTDASTLLQLRNNYHCDNFFSLSPVEPGSVHSFRVRGENSEGLGEWSDVAFFEAATAAPARPVSAPVIVKLNASAVELLMPHPKDNGMALTGISVQSLLDADVVMTMVVPVDGSTSNATHVTLDRLGFNTSVGFRYAGVNIHGTGGYSPAVIAGTEVTFEPAAPNLPVQDGVSSHSANITFEKPTTTNNPSAAGAAMVITRVDIQVETPGRPLIVHQLFSPQLASLCAGALSGPCSFSIQDLTPATEYSVRLMAWSVDGASPMSLPLVLTTPPDIPAPVSNIVPTILGQASNVVSDQIEVVWTPPATDNGRNITDIVVHACMWPSGSPCASASISDPTATQATVGDLLYGTNYTILIEAFNVMGSSGNVTAPNPPYTTYAEPLQPSLPVHGPALAGLPATSTIHAIWSPPFSNGLPLIEYNLIADGVPLVLSATDGYPQQVFTNLYPGTVHNLSVQAVNSKGGSPFSPTAIFTTDNDVPGPPVGISAEATGDGSTMRVHVDQAQYSGGPEVLYFILEWKTNRVTSVWEQVPNVGNRSVTAGTPYPMAFTVARPRLDFEYQFRARAVNELGGGAWTNGVRVASANAMAPPTPLNFAVLSSSPTSATFQWSMPPGANSTANGISYYTIELTPLTSHATDVDATITQALLLGVGTSDIECETPCQTMVTGLSAAAVYSVHIIAVNGGNGGFALGSLPSNAVNVTTSGTEPDAVPSLSVAVSPGSSSQPTGLSFSFSAPNNNGNAIANYTLTISDFESGSQYVHNLLPSSTQYAVSSLPAGRNFTASIIATNAMGPSVSTSITAVTPPAFSGAIGQVTTASAPLAAEPVFLATPVLDGLDMKTTIHVMWNAPFANGLAIAGYNLSVDEGTPSARYVDLPPSAVPQYVYGGLIPGTLHTFSVSAMNSYGAGMWSAVTSLNTTSDVPGRPPAPTYSAVDPHTLDVSISPAPYSGGSPVERYELSITTSVGTTVAFVYPPSLQYILAGRVPDLEYSFSVVARNGLGPSSPSSSVVAASVAVSTTPRSPEDVVIGSVDTNSFDITWRLPNNSFPAAYYLVRLYSSSGLTTVRVERNLTTDCRVDLCSGVVPGLRAYTAYNASIAALSFSDQPGFYSDRHAIFTLASVPEPIHPPPVPTLISNTSITLSWTAPEDNGRSIDSYVAWACPCDTALTLESYTYVRSCVHTTGTCARAERTTTAATLTGLTPGTMYMLAVEALNALGSSGNSTAAQAATTVSVPAQCASPTLGPTLEGLDTPRQQYIVWTAPPDNTRAISRYELREGGSNAAPLSFSAPNSSVSPPQYLATGLIPFTEYTYQVRATNSEGAGDWSLFAAFRTAKDVPSGLPQPTVSTDTPTTLAIEIGVVAYDGGEAVTAYEVVYCEEEGTAICFNGGQSDHAVNITTDGATIVNYYVPQRLQGIVYRFRARAWSALGAGAWSVELVVGSDAAAVRPASVRDVAIATTPDCTASVSWMRSSTASDLLYDVQLDCTYGSASATVRSEPLSLSANGTTCSGSAAACSWCADSLLPHGMLQCDALVRARRGSLYATSQYALSTVPSATGPAQPGTPVETGVSQYAAQLAWTMPVSYGAVVTGYQLEVAPTATDGLTPIGAWATETAGAMSTSLAVSSLQPGTSYLARLRAQNTLGLWSTWSPHLGVHTTARPDRPIAVTYAPGYSHLAKIRSMHLQWARPSSHGLPLAAQQLAVDDRIYPLDPNTTTYVVNHLAANTRLRVRVRYSNALGWSDWSADAFLVTDPDVPAVDLPPTCGDIFAHINGTTIRFETITVDLPSATDNGEAITLRHLRVFDVGPNRYFNVGRGARVDLSFNGSMVNMSNSLLSNPLDDEHAMRVVNISAGADSALLSNLFPGGCYRMQLASENVLGWGAYSGASDVCCTYEPEVLMEMVDVAAMAITGLGIGVFLLIFCIIVALCLIGNKFRQMFSGHNALIFGGRQKLQEEMDGSKKVERYMDNEYTPGIDDADDLTVNPVFLHKIDMEKQAKMRGKRAKIGACGQDAGNRSGGLKRLGFFMEEKVKNPTGGKSKTMADVEKFLAGQHGVDVSESRVMKNTRAGTKKGNVLLAAQTASQPAGLGTGNARAMARAAARAGAEQDDEEDDDAGTGQKYTAAL